MRQETIYLTYPKPLDEVGTEFIISGSVPESWLKTDFDTIDYRVFLDFLDINGKTFLGTSIPLKRSWVSKLTKRLSFAAKFKFDWMNIAFIEQSQGRITIQLSGQQESEQSIFVPIIVKAFEPEEGTDSKIIERHDKIGEMIRQYREDLKNYYKGSEEIKKSRRLKDDIFEDKESNTYSYARDWSITGGILDILSKAEEAFDDYLYKEEDEAEKELENKYKDALEWRGRLVIGIVGMMSGFEFRVYSNDHGKHFHVIHRGKGINARFSFPEIELLSYKGSKNTIGSREEANIRAFFQNPNNFKKLESEFQKRP